MATEWNVQEHIINSRGIGTRNTHNMYIRENQEHRGLCCDNATIYGRLAESATKLCTACKRACLLLHVYIPPLNPLLPLNSPREYLFSFFTCVPSNKFKRNDIHS